MKVRGLVVGIIVGIVFVIIAYVIGHGLHVQSTHVQPGFAGRWIVAFLLGFIAAPASVIMGIISVVVSRPPKP